jgi:hypothetical protein
VRRAYTQKVAMTQRVCRRIEAGASLTEACREPDLPGRSTVAAWLKAEPELADMVEAAQALAAETHPPRRTYHRWTPKVAAEVLARIEDGRGVREVCAEPDMPSAATVTRWLKERPDFQLAYRLAREAQADRLFDLAWRIACEATEKDVAVARLKIQTLKWRVGKLAPRVYGPLKAQEPPRGAGDEADGGDDEEVVRRFEVRHFARTPDRQVVETTGAARGLHGEALRALNEGIETGRISLDELAAMNAASEARFGRVRSG